MALRPSPFGPDSLIIMVGRFGRRVLAKVTVYSFRVWDHSQGGYAFPASKRTVANIGAIRGGEIIAGTGEDVEETSLDGDGRYLPPSKG